MARGGYDVVHNEIDNCLLPSRYVFVVCSLVYYTPVSAAAAAAFGRTIGGVQGWTTTSVVTGRNGI